MQTAKKAPAKTSSSSRSPSAGGKKASGPSNKFVSPVALAQNTSAAGDVILILELVGGCAAGILGVTGIWGFLVYFILHFIGAALVLMKLKWRPGDFFPESTPLKFLFNGILGNLLTYMLFWTISYGVIHMW